MSTLVVDAALQAAFEAAVYRVFSAAGDAMDSRIGIDEPRIAMLLRNSGATCAALLSACNPRGQRIHDALNRRRTVELLDCITVQGWRWLAAEGCSADGSWLEPGALILGMGPLDARRWAIRFDQAAWLEYDAQGRATLCWTQANEADA